MRFFPKSLLPSAALALAGACRVAQHEAATSSASSSVSVASSGPSGSSSSGAGGSGGAGPKCLAPSPPGLGQHLTLGTIQATLVDQDGKPAEKVVCSLCGVNLCSGPQPSDAGGHVTLKGPGAEQIDARFNVGYDGRGFAKMSAVIPTTPDFDFGTVRVIRLPAFSAGATIVAGKDAISAGVTLSPPAGAVVTFDDLEFDATQQRFVAAVVDIRNVSPAELPAVDPKLGLQVLIGTGALGTKICPAARLRFPNVAGWAAGTAVDIYVNGVDTYENYAPYGQWAVIAEATVDPDGATVTTNPGGGIEKLATFGARPKP